MKQRKRIKRVRDMSWDETTHAYTSNLFTFYRVWKIHRRRWIGIYTMLAYDTIASDLYYYSEVAMFYRGHVKTFCNCDTFFGYLCPLHDVHIPF